MDPTIEFVSATVCLLLFVLMVVCALGVKKSLDGSSVCVYAMVTHRWNQSNEQLSGFREHTYRVFAKWTNPYSQRTYYFVKESHHPLDYNIANIVPATINSEHPWSRYLNT